MKYFFKKYNQYYYFTLVELLIVIAIIGILASMLLPALRKARETAKTITCANNLKSFNTAHGIYQADWDGYMLPYYDVYWWEEAIGVYLGGWIQPSIKQGTVWTCPSNPEGNFLGNHPSYTRNNAIGSPGGTYNTTPLRFNAFRFPSYKIFMADGGINDNIMSTLQVCATEYGGANAKLSIRHGSKKCNIAFLDGHVKGYGCPPIPKLPPHWSEGAKWIGATTDPPDGL